MRALGSVELCFLRSCFSRLSKVLFLFRELATEIASLCAFERKTCRKRRYNAKKNTADTHMTDKVMQDKGSCATKNIMKKVIPEEG